MLPAPIPEDEERRQSALRATHLLDSLPEERFDRITRLARRLFAVPMALVSLIDSRRQWFKSRQGVAATETPRAISFCGHAILTDAILVVEDAREDPRFADNPLVTGAPGVRFYAGCPLAASDGSRIATLCIMSDSPRHFSEEDRLLLRTLAAMVESEIASLDLAITDPTTGLPNLRGFLEAGAFTLRSSQKPRRAVRLLLMQIREPSGAAARSPLTRAESESARVADALMTLFPDADIVARLGPRMFAVLLCEPPVTGAGGASAGGDLTSRLRHDPIVSPLAAAASVAQYDPALHAALEDLLLAAERDLRPAP